MKKRHRRRYNNHIWVYSIIACICLLTMGIGYALLSAENNFNVDVTKTTQPAGDTIKNLLGSNTSVTSGDGTLEKITHSGVSQTDSKVSYRYRGANPNNYVTFNGETAGWRIIGIVDGKVKLIRNESISDYGWNIKNKNEWPGGSLQVDLNGDYYNSLTTTAKAMIEESTWYLGGWYTAEGMYSNTMYEKERGTTVYVDNDIARSTKTTDKIAIMYPSDYGYGAPSSCTEDLSNYRNDTNCAASDWLFSIREWTLAPDSESPNYAFYVGNSGSVNYGNASVGYGVRPTVYLNGNVQITGGDGSQSKPYTLQIN